MARFVRSFLLCISVRGDKQQHTTVNMDDSGGGDVYSRHGIQVKTSWPTVTVGAKRLNKSKRRLIREVVS